MRDGEAVKLTARSLVAPRMSKLIPVLAVALLLSACGQSGALYLPERNGKKAKPAPTPVTEPAAPTPAPAAPDAAAPAP